MWRSYHEQHLGLLGVLDIALGDRGHLLDVLPEAGVPVVVLVGHQHAPSETGLADPVLPVLIGQEFPDDAVPDHLGLEHGIQCIGLSVQRGLIPFLELEEVGMHQRPGVRVHELQFDIGPVRLELAVEIVPGPAFPGYGVLMVELLAEPPLEPLVRISRPSTLQPDIVIFLDKVRMEPDAQPAREREAAQIDLHGWRSASQGTYGRVRKKTHGRDGDTVNDSDR